MFFPFLSFQPFEQESHNSSVNLKGIVVLQVGDSRWERSMTRKLSK